MNKFVGRSVLFVAMLGTVQVGFGRTASEAVRAADKIDVDMLAQKIVRAHDEFVARLADCKIDGDALAQAVDIVKAYPGLLSNLWMMNDPMADPAMRELVCLELALEKELRKPAEKQDSALIERVKKEISVQRYIIALREEQYRLEKGVCSKKIS